jgi:hypothetical protein
MCFYRYEGQIPAESIGQLVLLSGQECLFIGEHLKYMLRLYWLKAHLFLNQGNSEIAMQSLHTVRKFLLVHGLYNILFLITGGFIGTCFMPGGS